MAPTSTPAHLGGNVPGGDPATWYPELWTWLYDVLGVRSVLDVGCGEGVSTEFFARLGMRAVGVDGVAPTSPLCVQHDFTQGPWPVEKDGWRGTIDFDLVWCCEFVEHVEERFRDNFAAAFQSARTVMVTHASPNQAGHHHVNCRNPEYWANWLGLLGYELDEGLTGQTRAIAALNQSPWNHYLRSGLAFRRA